MRPFLMGAPQPDDPKPEGETLRATLHNLHTEAPPKTARLQTSGWFTL
jgi:hypothetical protein